ncbi:hypothetical protein [Lagierella sp.]|uniref:hypothetical protein n=1 Tax=Lagierella sp. TaxID=2849657 RepID=UPI00262F9B86|nr:hypothetical protein [Lagierella sp.]
MKKFFTVILALILALSIFGIYDNAKRKKEAEEKAKMTSVFYGEIESMEKVGEETKFTVKGLEESPEEFRGKVYEFTTNEDFNPINKDGSPATTDIFKEKDQVAIRHIGKIEAGDVNKLTGEVTMSPFVNPVKNPPTITDDKAKVTESEDKTKDSSNSTSDKGGEKPTETGSKE